MKPTPQPHAILRLALAALAAVASTTAAAQAQDLRPGRWSWIVSSYLWAASLDGDATVGGVKADIEEDFDDVLDDLAFGAMLFVEGRKGRFGIGLDGFAVSVDADAEGPGDRLEIDARSDTAALDTTAFYRVVEATAGGMPERRRLTFGLEPYAGARLTYIRGELEAQLDLDAIDFSDERQVDRSEAWVDPIIGLRAVANLGDHWSLRLSGDVGGFGVGSDFTWNALGVLGYRLELGRFDTVLGVGYRALHWNYDDDGFELDVTQRGPVLGAALRF